MVSVISMIITSIVTAFLYVLKAVFSLLMWFLKSMLRVFKLFFSALPLTSIVFVLLLALNIFILFTGSVPVAPAVADSIPGSIAGNEMVKNETGNLILKGTQTVGAMSMELKTWWNNSIYVYRGTISYIILLLLTILMFVPVITVFLVLSVIASYGPVLFIAVVADAGLYLIRALLGQTFVSQALGRYYRLFPEAGRKYEERKYDKLLKRRNRELEREEREYKRRKSAGFYEDDEYPENDFYEDEEDYPEDDFYEDDGYYEEDDYHEEDGYYEDDDSLLEDEEYGEDSEEYLEDGYYEDDDYIEGDDDYCEDEDEDYEEDDGDGGDYGDDDGSPRASSTFDFFAGCTSKESADRKYKQLVKLYHPDNMDGDTAALQEINAQYAEVKKRWN